MVTEMSTHCIRTQKTRTYEQVEHDVGYDDVKGAEVDERSSVVPTVGFPVSMLVWGAERSLNLQKEELF